MVKQGALAFLGEKAQERIQEAWNAMLPFPAKWRAELATGHGKATKVILSHLGRPLPSRTGSLAIHGLWSSSTERAGSDSSPPLRKRKKLC